MSRMLAMSVGSRSFGSPRRRKRSDAGKRWRRVRHNVRA